MARKLDYRWNLRQVMADRGMFQTTDLIGPLAERGIHLSSSQGLPAGLVAGIESEVLAGKDDEQGASGAG